MAIMSLMKQFTAELPGIAYIYEQETPVVDFNRFGVDEYIEYIALPTLRGDWAAFNRIYALIRTTVNGAVLVGAAATVDSTIQLLPSTVAVLGMGPGAAQAGFAAPQATQRLEQTTLFGGLPTIFVSVARPANFFGFPTGTFTWNITIRLYGLIYIKTAATDTYNYV